MYVQRSLKRGLMRVFVIRLKKLRILGYPKSVLWRFWSDCANAQADLNLDWACMSGGTFSDDEVRLTSYAVNESYGRAAFQTMIWASAWQNLQKGMCAQRRLRSAWASTQSDQSVCCPHAENLDPQLPTERTAKTLIRLGGCPGWSESSLDANAILQVLTRAGSFCWSSGTGRPRWLSRIRIRLVIRKSRVRSPPGLATFFCRDWSWNIFYGHSLPSADSTRAAIRFWRKNVHYIQILTSGWSNPWSTWKVNGTSVNSYLHHRRK